jgi:cation:H+ antiporter
MNCLYIVNQISPSCADPGLLIPAFNIKHYNSFFPYSFNMILNFILLFVGFIVLIYGANFLVNGASSLAKRFNVSELAIGLTVVAFGTSTPELIVSAISSMQGHNEVAFGNVIGSNIFNLYMILGAAGVIYPIMVQSSTVWKEIPYSLLAALLLFVLANDVLIFNKEANVLSLIDGLILLAFFAAFIWYVFVSIESDPSSAESPIKIFGMPKTLLLIATGLAGLILGGKLVVDNAIEIAQSFGVSEKLIGLTIVAAGTSLPELATSVVAALKKRSDIAIGNVVGSNIFNIFLILSICSIIKPIPYNAAMNTDIFVILAGTALVFIAMFAGKARKLDRWEAAILLLAYVGYVGYLIKQG